VSRYFVIELFGSPTFWDEVGYFKNFWFYSNYHQGYFIPEKENGQTVEGTDVAVIRFEWSSNKWEEALKKIINIFEIVGGK
jgi:hypothetical protein